MCGAAVSWRSFKQQRVSGSSTESEYYSLWAATREVMHTRRQMKECGFEQFEPTVVNEDNQATKHLSEDVVESTRTRHWDKEYHQIREEFERGTILVAYCDTTLNAADVLTKALSEPIHNRHTNVLCGLDWDADHDIVYQRSLPKDRRSSWGGKELDERCTEKSEEADQGTSVLTVKGASEPQVPVVQVKGVSEPLEGLKYALGTCTTKGAISGVTHKAR